MLRGGGGSVEGTPMGWIGVVSWATFIGGVL